MATDADDVDVVIVGAGMVGSALAIECGQRGLRCVVADPRADVLPYYVKHPRAKLMNLRTTAHFRRWGIISGLNALDPLPSNWPRRVVFGTSVISGELAAFENVFGADPSRHDAYPERSLWIPQPLVEEHLRTTAASYPSVSLRLGERVTRWEEHVDDLTVRLEDSSGGSRSVRSRFLVGCDGARSLVRATLGIEMQGATKVLRGLGIVLKLRRPLLGVLPAIQHWCINGRATGLGGPLDERGHWFVQMHIDDDDDPTSADIDSLLEEFFGVSVDAEILDISLWEADELVAESYRCGSVFLAGDAAHLNPPYGGHGVNTGVGDAVDLGWKISAVAAGWGGPRLLDSYEVERRPVAERVVDAAVANSRYLGPDLLALAFDPRSADSPEGEIRTMAGEDARRKLATIIGRDKEREFRSLGLVLGIHYEGSPIVAVEAGPPLAAELCTYEPSARPGSLAPHGWLANGASLYDYFGVGYTLLSFGTADVADTRRFEDVASELAIPLSHFEAPLGLHQLYGAGMALVRPDQHVAWRGDHCPGDLRTLLNLVRGAD